MFKKEKGFISAITIVNIKEMSIVKKILSLLLFVLTFLILPLLSMAQTSWKGTISTAWNNAGNWTAGVPTSTVDAVLGDASFTGSFQPAISSSASCKSLTVGGTVATTLTVGKNLTVLGNVTINSNGSLSQNHASITLKGNWSNAGSYSTGSNSATVIFSGTVQSLGGSSVTSFRKLTISIGSTLTLGANVTVTGGSSRLTINGTLNPSESPTYTITSPNLTLAATGTLKVNAATFTGNYNISGTTTLTAGCIVEYSATALNQTISNSFTYSTLQISGSGTKTLAGNLPALNSTSVATGNINIIAGTLDLSTFTANRGTTVAGGSISLAIGTTLKIGGTGTFPVNYINNTMSLTSTVEYSGTSQTVGAQTYGNLTLSASSGSATRTFPGTAFAINGNLVSTIGTGTSLSFTAASDITVGGHVTIGASTTFNGGSFSHNIAGNWINSGTFTGSTSTISLTGAGTSISGTGTHNFNNLDIAASGITAAATSSINVAGNLSTSGSGAFTHSSGGTLTMSGSSKTISGSSFIFDNLTISGTITSSSSINLAGNLSVGGTFTHNSGIFTMSGTSKTISGAGTISFGSLAITGGITAAVNFSISSSLDVSGTLSATANTATFTGTSTLNGTANLFNVTLNGTSLSLATSAVLGIANTLTVTAGSLNVTANTPNTVNFNGSGTQSVNAITYNALMLSNGSTKTAAGGITVNGDLTIGASTTFNASSFTHSILGNWVNSGIFTASTSTIQLTGTFDTGITGATTFNTLTINKTASNIVTLVNDINADTLNMTTGGMNTGSQIVNITTTRTGNGIIIGNIRRTHAFAALTAYAFEGPDNTLTITGVNTISSVTVSVTKGAISDFPFGGSINRVYTISITGSFGISLATLRLHYEDAELNGNTESTMQLWRNNGASWAASGKTGNNTTSNYVEQALLSSITARWTLSDNANVIRWNGSVSTAWNNASNWTTVQGSPTSPPGASDIVQIGTAAFTNQPTISTGVTVKGIVFGSTQAATLTIDAGGSLTTNGNINGSWSGNATHTLATGNQNITVNGDLTLSDGTTLHAINLSIGTGTVGVTGSVTQSGGANITFSGAGALNIGSNFTYSSGTFTGSSGTVTYNGSSAQSVAGITYNHLIINKSAGIAVIGAATTIAGNLTVSAGELDINVASTISGNVNISSGATLNGDGINTSVGGNWTNNGSFISASGTITFNGTGTQSISASTFNNLTVNKTGTATLTGNVTVNGNFAVLAGTMDLSTFTCNRFSSGGICTVANGATLSLSGSNNFPSLYATYTFGSTSTTEYQGTVAQSIVNITYGHLVLKNGGATAKTLTGTTVAGGDLFINSGATLNGSSYTLTLQGDYNNSGSFTASTSTVILNGGTSGNHKQMSGTTTFYNFIIKGYYTSSSGTDVTILGDFELSGYFDSGTCNKHYYGDINVSGTMSEDGTATFMGTQVQTLRFTGTVLSPSLTQTVVFAGTIAPITLATTSPTLINLSITNTSADGVRADIGITVLGAFSVSSGCKWSNNSASAVNTFMGSFVNNGTVVTNSTMLFAPSFPLGGAPSSTIYLGSGTNFQCTGTVEFGGANELIINGAPDSFHHVLITNTNASGITPVSNWTITGDLSISGNAIFNAGTYTHTVKGDIESDGTLNGTSSTFIMSGTASDLTASSNTTFNHLTITGDVTVHSDFKVAGNFTNNGTFDGTIGTVVMTGATAATIGGTTIPSTIAQLTIAKNTGIATTMAVNISAITDLNITNGTLQTSTFTITKDQNGGQLTITDNGTLKLGGTNTLPAFDTYTLDTLSTVDYAGSTQAVSTVTRYGNLTVSTAGTKTASAALYILGSFSLTNGTFVPGSFADTLEGNWTMPSGTFTNTGSTFVFHGAHTQDISSTGTFNHLTVNKTTNNLTTTSNVTINGILKFSAGKIQTGSSYSVILPAAGSVTGATQGTGWVYGKLQKNIATGTNVSRVFETGDNNSYTPATVLFASVTTPGDLSTVALTPDHTSLASSAINTNKSVNRYWSFANSATVFTTASVTLNWVAADVDAGAATANFKVADYNGSTWSVATVASPLPTSIQATGLSFIGDLAVGELVSSDTWTGSVSTNWYITGNWATNALPLISTNIIIPSSLSNYPVITTGTATTNNITIQSGASLTVNGGALQVAGSINNSGTFTTSNGSIEFTGSTAQIIPASVFAGNLIKDLTTNNTAGVTLSGTLQVSGILKATTGQFSTGGHLTLLSTSSQTALIDGSGAGSVTGNVTMQRYLAAGFGYKYFSSPFVSATVNEFADDLNLTASFPAFYTYIENRASSGFTAYTTTTGALTPMLGYAAQFGATATPKTVDMTGVVNNGTITSPTIYNHNQPYTLGFNLSGNPYPSPIDWDAVSGWTRTNIDNAIYYFDAGTTDQYAGTYSSYINGISSNGTANNIIPAMQGFFVHVTNGTYPVTATFSVNNNARVNNLTPNFHRDAPATVPLLRLNASFADEGMPADATVIYFDHSATSVFNPEMDALKLINTAPQVPSLYTLSDTTKLSIYALPYLQDSTSIIPLGLITQKAGPITFKVQDIERMPYGLHIYLRDAKTGITQDLQRNPVYSLPIEKGVYKSRFSIVFSMKDLNNDDSNQTFYVYSTGGKVYVKLDLAAGEKGDIVMSNTAGQVIFNRQVSFNGYHDLGPSFSSGIYFISFHSQKGVRTKKIFVGNYSL